MSLTPLQQIERERSEMRVREVFVRDTLAKATDEHIWVFANEKIDEMVAKTELNRQEAVDLQRASRMRIMIQWLKEMGFNV